jgi:hypothetical protein
MRWLKCHMPLCGIPSSNPTFGDRQPMSDFGDVPPDFREAAEWQV